MSLLWFLQPSTATGRTRPILHRARSAYTIKPKSASTKAAAARRPSTANNDSATNSRKTYFDPGGYWEREDMGSIKDRLSIQTFLPQALRVQSPPSTPTSSTHAGSSTASSRRCSSRSKLGTASSARRRLRRSHRSPQLRSPCLQGIDASWRGRFLPELLPRCYKRGSLLLAPAGRCHQG